MMTGIHFLTTLACNFECDHCFTYSGPGKGGTFTIAQVRAVLDEAVRIGTIDMIYFEGGEPLLYYPLVLEGIDEARRRGFKTGIVTNAYWATSEEDALLWLRPLAARGMTALRASDDGLHYGDARGKHNERIMAAAKELGLDAKVFVTERPAVQCGADGQAKIAGGVMFRGRAADKLVDGMPRRPWETLTKCPHENLKDPGRVHVDAFGNAHLCQGLSLGNFWQTPFADLVRGYAPEAHPIVGPLLRGGPAELARVYGVPHEEGYVDECHFCYVVRKALIERFPQYLAPRQIYGLTTP